MSSSWKSVAHLVIFIMNYVPGTLLAAGKNLRVALRGDVCSLPTEDFLHAWYSLAYLYPGLHPDGFESADSGWPNALKCVASEAWRRYESGELHDEQLYCYEAAKARLIAEVGATALESFKKPWLFTDHFAA